MESFDLRLWPAFAAAGGDPSSPAPIDQITVDSRRIDSHNSLFIALQGIQDGHQFVKHAARSGAKYAIVSRRRDYPADLKVHLLLVDDPLHAFQEIAQSYRREMKALVVGIAGTHGKTMVKDLLLAMVSSHTRVIASPESFNSQIGVPLSLLTIKKHHEVALIEAAVSETKEMDRLTRMIAPDCSILTHLGKKHLTTLGSMENIANETVKLLKHPPANRWVILPRNPWTAPHLHDLKARSYFWNEPTPLLPHAHFLPFGKGAGMIYQVDFPDGTRYLGHATSGFYYLLDLINISAKAAWLLGVSADSISATLHQYDPEPMRTEIWKSMVGATFINDTYCSDPQSVDQAFKHFAQVPESSRKIFIFSGMRGKQEHPEKDYRRIGQAIHRAQIDKLTLVGSYPYASLVAELAETSPRTEISQSPTFTEALNQLRTDLTQDDVVLIKGDKKYSLDSLTETFNDSIGNNRCMINLEAIRANLETVRHRLPPGTRIMVIVKALAYGTDDVRMSKFFATCDIDILGVSYVDEGVTLKRAGVSQTIFVINAGAYEAAKVVKWGLDVGVSERTLIESLAAEAGKQNKKIGVHLHVDTGMNRFGCRPEEALSLARSIKECPMLQLQGIMTHFPAADNPENDDFTLEQARRFDEVIDILARHDIHPPWQHAANSGAVIRFKFPQYNMVRIGLAVYGLHCSESVRKELELRQALSLLSRVAGINVCRAGETVSYGLSYKVTRERQHIAVLPIGYFDGLHRNYSEKGHVLIRGHKAPMVGKICMDYMMVDVTDIPHVSIGDPVLIFGEDEYGHYLSPEDLATSGNSIVHELITCLGPRIQRIFVYEESKNRSSP